jgi:hypothetical protein
MQQAHDVTILTTRLGQTDRRALSEAWYAALHVAAPNRAGRPATVTGTPTRAPRPERANAARNGAARGAAAASVAMRNGRPATAPASGVPAAARDGARAAEKLARALTLRVLQRPASSFTVRSGDGRVHVVVCNDGARTRLVALCAPALRERVAQALAHARFVLAAHGISSEVA